jgi:hypothetical protein
VRYGTAGVSKLSIGGITAVEKLRLGSKQWLTSFEADTTMNRGLRSLGGTIRSSWFPGKTFAPGESYAQQ